MNERSIGRSPKQVACLPPDCVVAGVRRRILEGALHLFATRRFHGASSALHPHFAPKAKLMAELVPVGHEAHCEEIRVAMLEAGADPVAQLCAIVRANVRMHTSYPDLAILANSEQEVLSPDLAAPGLALRKQSVALLVA